MSTCKPGRLIGASLGPGDPELITRRAWAALGSGARWAYPVKKAEESSYALSIVERGGIPVPADAVELVFPMTRDADILAKAWARAAVQTVELLGEGRDLVFLVEGDASTFATFGHLARVVRELVTAQGQTLEVETIPGVSSFAAAAATTGMVLMAPCMTTRESLSPVASLASIRRSGYFLESLNFRLSTGTTSAPISKRPSVSSSRSRR